MEKHVTEDSKRVHDDESNASGNVDSGFLSGGNLQYSGEIRNSGLIEGHRKHRSESEQRPAAASITAVSSSSSSSSSSSLSSLSSSLTASTKISREPMRVVDSSLNVDLSENLSLNLKHVSLNPLSGKERIQTEPANVELIFVTTRENNGSPDTQENRDECKTSDDDDNDEHDSRTTDRSNEENWQLYYTQNNDGDM